MTRRRRTRLVLVIAAIAAVAAVVLVARATSARSNGHVDAGDAPVGTVAPPPREQSAVGGPAVRWSNPVRGEPDGVTVSGSDVATVEFDEVRVLDLASGAARWRTELPGLARARAVFTENRVIVGTRTDVVLLDRATGRRVGAVPFAEAEHLVLTQAGGHDVVVATNLDGAIAGVDAATGTSLWSRSYDGSVVDPPAADGGLVVANWDLGADTAMRVLSATTGEVVWDLALGASSTPPALAGGRVFVAAGDTDAEAVFVAFDATTGRPLWSGAFPAPWDQSAAPVVAGDTIYLLDRVGTVTAVDVVSGQPRWQTRTHTSVLYGRMVANARTVIFQTFDDHVVALDRATGKLVSATSEDAFPIDVAATDDTVLVALRRGAPSRIEARPAP
jgi:outer membrane protein assembly factor BamB